MKRVRTCKQGHRVTAKNRRWHTDKRSQQGGRWECWKCRQASNTRYWKKTRVAQLAKQAVRRKSAEGAEKHRMDHRRRCHTRMAILRTLLGDACKRCGGVERLEFHHRDPRTKLFSIGSNISRPMAELKREARKCDLLCLPCHRKAHYALKKAA